MLAAGILAAGLLAAALAPGCASGPDEPATGAAAARTVSLGGGGGGGAGIQPVEPLISVCPGTLVVIPVTLAGPIPSGGTVPVRFGDLPPVRGTVVWVGVRPGSPEEPAQLPAPFATAWMGQTGLWSATPASQSTRPVSAGTWAVVADVPQNLSGERTLRIADRPAPLVVTPEACRAGFFGLDVPPPPHLPADTVRDLRSSPWLARTLDAQARSPVNRWRARLAWRLLEGGVAPSAAAAAWDIFSDPVLEALARQAEWRWAAGLSRLAAIDPALASAVAWRLAAVADLGAGVAMPVWPLDDESLATLSEDLLNPVLSDGEAAARARAWLREQPDAVAWILDDGGATDALTGGLIATAAVTNLELDPGVAWAAHELAPRAGELTSLPPRSTARIASSATGRENAQPQPIRAAAPSPNRLRIQAGELAASRAVASAPAAAAPPGLRIGPLLPDWTLPDWLAHGAGPDPAPELTQPIDESWATTALLYREAVPSTGRARWVLYLECRRAALAPQSSGPAAPPPAGGPGELIPGLGQVRRPPAAASAPNVVVPPPAARGPLSAGEAIGADEELRIWIGPLGDPTALLRITAAGLMIDEIGPAAPTTPGAVRRGPGEPIPIRRDADSWSCWVPIPDHCVEDTGLLRIGVERTDARGVRTAWPRRMLPWQREPARAAIVTSTWPDL